MMLENERLVKKFANATKDSKVVYPSKRVMGKGLQMKVVLRIYLHRHIHYGRMQIYGSAI